MTPKDAVKKLRANGWTYQRIGEQVGVHYSQPLRWLQGTDPSWTAGQAVIALARRSRKRRKA